MAHPAVLRHDSSKSKCRPVLAVVDSGQRGRVYFHYNYSATQLYLYKYVYIHIDRSGIRPIAGVNHLPSTAGPVNYLVIIKGCSELSGCVYIYIYNIVTYLYMFRMLFILPRAASIVELAAQTTHLHYVTTYTEYTALSQRVHVPI